MKRTTVFGLLAFGFSLSYLYMKARDEDSDNIEGIEIKINPEKLVDGALAMSSITPQAQDGIRQITQRAIKRYYEN